VGRQRDVTFGDQFDIAVVQVGRILDDGPAHHVQGLFRFRLRRALDPQRAGRESLALIDAGVVGGVFADPADDALPGDAQALDLLRCDGREIEVVHQPETLWQVAHDLLEQGREVALHDAEISIGIQAVQGYRNGRDTHQRAFHRSSQRTGIEGGRGIVAAMVDAADDDIRQMVGEELADAELDAAGRGAVQVVPGFAGLGRELPDGDGFVSHRDAHRGPGLDIFGSDDRDFTVGLQDVHECVDALGTVSVVVCYEYLHS
jgi:hypothetical protein